MNSYKMRIIEISTLIFISFSPLISNEIKAISTLILVMLNLKYIKSIEVNKTFSFFLFISMFVLGSINEISAILKGDSMNILSMYFPLCIILGFIMSHKYKKNEFLILIEKVIFIFAVLSLVGVIIYTFFPEIVYRFPKYNYYHTTRHTAYIFNYVISDAGGVVQRNSGIAWEPGAFQFLLNIALYAYLKTSKEISTMKLFIYIIAIFTTRSTAGIFILIIITLKLVLKNRKVRWAIIGIILISIVPLKEELVYQYNNKLNGSYAFDIRLEPMLNAFKIGFMYPLGLSNAGYDQLVNVWNIGAWDSYGQIVVRYGYGLLICVLVSFLKISREDKVLFLILLITFFSQSIWFFPLVTPFYFMTDLSKKNGSMKNENFMVN